MYLKRTSLSFVLMACMAQADAPNVAADIAPVHSLVARVMQGVGEPKLIIQPEASPHGYSLRPTEAAAIQEADLVIWMGPELTPWLEEKLHTLMQDGESLALLETSGGTILEYREEHGFGSHDHGDEHGHDDDQHDEEHHDDHADNHGEDHEEHAEHDDHDDHEEHVDHEGEGHNPHAWLDPANAGVWMRTVAKYLAEIDPENAAQYQTNAEAGQIEMEALLGEVNELLTSARSKPYLVFHDAYQYFEERFDVPAQGAIALGDASAPGPARVAALRDVALDTGATCIFSEPQFDPKIARSVFGDDVTIAVLDPLGHGLPVGINLYPQLIRNLGQNLADCLGQ
ncbi:High-affinity zinc uptake system protein ZnuA precursor [Roseovarius albus]|uniref:High-affinity zinc uptake system protein ZnuA n=1 Tax=Roseovarius albus TaxID=1247867 RepID=A0A1X6YGQ7_9RHOB|nr:zinc ABC transporter substrate-binding protein [Roseovarius albus]SLN20870.1 High-affinity zinc uptake system protein ZnuA precursor [Roseovarius albus]